MAAIPPISPASVPPVFEPIRAPSLAGESPSAAESVFGQAFNEAIGRVQSFEQQSRTSLDRFLNGESEEIHQVALDAQRASLQFEFFLQMRNKVVQAYQEIMRQQL